MLGKQLEKLDLNLVGRFSGTSWGQKVNFAANAGLQFVARGLQVPTKVGAGLGNMLTPGGREFWTGEERTEAAGPYRQQQINALNAAGNQNLPIVDRALNAAAAVVSTPAVVIEETVVAPAMKVPQQCSDVGVHIAQAQNTADPVQKAVHYLEATKSGAEAAGTMLGLVVGAKGGLDAASESAAPRVPTGDVGTYTTKIKWGIHEVDARPAGPGFWGERIPQLNPRVNAFELKVNPANESYYLPHPEGGYVQFENVARSGLQDAKLVMNPKSSIYRVGDMPPFAQSAVRGEASRQLTAARAHGFKVEWLVSDPRAQSQLRGFFRQEGLKIKVNPFAE
jgi:hypothetical protein